MVPRIMGRRILCVPGEAPASMEELRIMAADGMARTIIDTTAPARLMAAAVDRSHGTTARVVPMAGVAGLLPGVVARDHGPDRVAGAGPGIGDKQQRQTPASSRLGG